MLNKAILIGRLTRDPELRYTTNGKSVGSFTIAVERNFSNQQGEKEADFIPVVTWAKTAELCAQYLSKGRLVAVSGRIQTRSYDAQDGQKKYVTEVVADEVQFLDWGKDQGDQRSNKEPKNNKDDVDTDFTSVDDDNIPF